MASDPNKKQVRDRLVLGLSCMDVVFSVACIQSTFAGPTYLNHVEEIADRFHLTGTVGTCRFQGFLYMVGAASPLYNAGLCLYFYLSVCHSNTMTDERIRKCVEPTIHASVWFFGLASGIIAVSMNTIAFAGYQGCYIFDPHGGRDDEICPSPDQAPNNTFPECQREDFSAILMIAIFMGLPHLAAIIAVVVFMSLIYRYVRAIEQRASRWMMSSQLQRQQSDAMGNDDLGTHVTADDIPPPVVDQESGDTTQNSGTQRTMEASIATVEGNPTSSSAPAPAPALVETKTASVINTRSSNSRRRSSVTAAPARMSNRISETGLSYVLAYLLTYLFVWLQILVYGGTKEATVLQLLSSMFMPMQGFFNCLAYTWSKAKVIQDSNTSRGASTATTVTQKEAFLRALQIK